jgi:hypothetical protein
LAVRLATPDEIRRLQRKLYVRAKGDDNKVPGRGTRPFSNRYFYEELGLVRLDDRRRMSRLHALT